MFGGAGARAALVAVQVPDRDWRPVLPGSATTWREQVRQGYDRGGARRRCSPRPGSSAVETRGRPTAASPPPRRRSATGSRTRRCRCACSPSRSSPRRCGSSASGSPGASPNAIFVAGAPSRLNQTYRCSASSQALAESSAATTPSRVCSRGRVEPGRVEVVVDEVAEDGADVARARAGSSPRRSGVRRLGGGDLLADVAGGVAALRSGGRSGSGRSGRCSTKRAVRIAQQQGWT